MTAVTVIKILKSINTPSMYTSLERVERVTKLASPRGHLYYQSLTKPELMGIIEWIANNYVKENEDV